MEFGEFDRKPEYASKGQLERLRQDFYSLSDHVFGQPFLDFPFENYTASPESLELDLGQSANQIAELEFVITVGYYKKARILHPTHYSLQLTIGEPSQKYDGLFLMATKCFDLDPVKLKAEIVNLEFMKSEDGGIIMNGILDANVKVGEKEKSNKNPKKIARAEKAVSKICCADLVQIYDCMHAFGYVEHLE